MEWAILFISLSITTISSPSLSLLPQGFYILMSYFGHKCVNLKLQPCVNFQVSNLLFCSPISSASPEANRVEDTCISFYNFSFYSNFPIQASASSWALVAGRTTCSEGQPLQQSLVFLFCHSAQCTVSQASTLKQLVPGASCTHAVVHKHLVYGPPPITERSVTNSRFPLWLPLSQYSFLCSPGQLDDCWFANCPCTQRAWRD